MDFLSEVGLDRLWLHIVAKIGQGCNTILDSLGALAKKDTVEKSDLDQSIQNSLDKADTALQSAPVTSVNGKTGDVVLEIPDISTAELITIADIDTICGASINATNEVMF